MFLRNQIALRIVALWIVALPCGSLPAEEPPKPLTPAEAAKKIDQKVTVEMEVKSTGGNTACYLNSDPDFQSASNFTIFLPAAALVKFKAAGIENPRVHFKSKTIQVAGTVVLFKEKPQIKVEDPKQITLVEKK